MVTGDLNAALVEWVVQYRIEDPRQYLFDVRNPEGTLRDLSEAAMREVVGDRTVDELITVGREWREDKPHLGVILRTVSVRRGAHFAARFCKELIVFRATFSSARFAAVGAQWD